MKTGKKRFLMIASSFPPRSGSAKGRITHFVKELHEIGWEPIVITYPGWGNEIEDHSMMKYIPPGIKVYRPPTLNPYSIYFALKSHKFQNQNPPLSSIDTLNDNRLSLSELLKSFYHSVSVPDTGIYWAPFAVIWGLAAVIKHKPSVIFTTAGPNSAALAGLCLKKITRLPWVCEFQDPWTMNTMRNFDNFRGGIEKWMEKQCLKNADYITALTEFTMESFRRLSPPDKPASDFFTVPMGFALEDFINFPPPPPPDDKIFRIVYTGMFYDQHGPQYFFSGLKSAATANDDFRKSTEIIIAGTMPENYLTLLKEEPLKSMVKLLPYQDHDKTIELMSKADVLYLTLTSGMTEIIPGKLFEYLAARRPILATIPLKGITAQYLRRFEGNLMTESEDVDGIKRALLEMFDRYKTGGLKVDYTLNDLNEFTWKTQAAKMAEILDKASKFSER